MTDNYMVYCPLCNDIVEKASIKQHLLDIHSRVVKASSPLLRNLTEADSTAPHPPIKLEHSNPIQTQKNIDSTKTPLSKGKAAKKASTQTSNSRQEKKPPTPKTLSDKKAKPAKNVYIERVKCEVCGNFVNQPNLDRHLKKKHNQKPEPQKTASSYISPKPQHIPKANPNQIILISKRGSRADTAEFCDECFTQIKPFWRYSKSNRGPVHLCSRCKPIVFDRSFPKIDLMNSRRLVDGSYGDGR
ncbi:MAG: hypothetical protein KF893_05070 [Caldilineaceae bacterium]|nr:hypothetical protein [Caldilineaceae bacterium]